MVCCRESQVGMTSCCAAPPTKNYGGLMCFCFSKACKRNHVYKAVYEMYI